MTMLLAGPSRANAERLRERLAGVFRTADVGDVFTDDLFLDGPPPFWRFQPQGVYAFASWLTGYSQHGIETTVVRTDRKVCCVKSATAASPK